MRAFLGGIMLFALISCAFAQSLPVFLKADSVQTGKILREIPLAFFFRANLLFGWLRIGVRC